MLQQRIKQTERLLKMLVGVDYKISVTLLQEEPIKVILSEVDQLDYAQDIVSKLLDIFEKQQLKKLSNYHLLKRLLLELVAPSCLDKCHVNQLKVFNH